MHLEELKTKCSFGILKDASLKLGMDFFDFVVLLDILKLKYQEIEDISILTVFITPEGTLKSNLDRLCKVKTHLFSIYPEKEEYRLILDLELIENLKEIFLLQQEEQKITDAIKKRYAGISFMITK